MFFDYFLSVKYSEVLRSDSVQRRSEEISALGPGVEEEADMH
jgi:hypothetical protein